MPIYALIVTGGREDLVADLIEKIAKRENLAIYSITQIPGLSGYLFVEAENSLEVQRAIIGIRNAKKVLPQEVNVEDILKYFKKEEVVVKEGDIIQILVGALKDAKAKVIKVDDKKKEVTVELLDVPIPLNITLPISNVKVLKEEK